jgi:hypothetical protein
VEIKAVSELTDDHRGQVHNYLRATGYRLGLLVNRILFCLDSCDSCDSWFLSLLVPAAGPLPISKGRQ